MVQGSARVFDDPSRRVAIFDLVGQERIANAMSLETFNNNAGKIIGPFLGGVLIAGAGFVGAYVALTVLALTNLVLVLCLRLRARTVGTGTRLRVWQSLAEGVKQCWQNPIMFGVLCITLTVNGLVFPIQYFIPVIASDILSVGPVLGGVLGAAEGIGTLIGAVGLAMVRTIRRHGVIFVTGSLIAAAAVVLVSISPWFALSFTVLFLGGLGQAGFSTMQSTILLLAPPPEMRGRAMGAQGLAAGLGHLVGGSGVGAVGGLHRNWPRPRPELGNRSTAGPGDHSLDARSPPSTDAPAIRNWFRRITCLGPISALFKRRGRFSGRLFPASKFPRQ